MIPPLTPLQIAALITVTIGAVHDLLTSKIPNWLTFGSAAIALAMGFYLGSVAGLMTAVTGWATGTAVSLLIKMLPVWLKRYKEAPIGYGDTKLIAAAGAFLGPTPVLLVYYYFCLWYGALWALQLLRAIPWLQIMLFFTLPRGTNPLEALDRERLRRTGQASIPIGPAIALGTACAVFLEKPTLAFFGFV